MAPPTRAVYYSPALSFNLHIQPDSVETACGFYGLMVLVLIVVLVLDFAATSNMLITLGLRSLNKKLGPAISQAAQPRCATPR